MRVFRKFLPFSFLLSVAFSNYAQAANPFSIVTERILRAAHLPSDKIVTALDQLEKAHKWARELPIPLQPSGISIEFYSEAMVGYGRIQSMEFLYLLGPGDSDLASVSVWDVKGHEVGGISFTADVDINLIFGISNPSDYSGWFLEGSAGVAAKLGLGASFAVGVSEKDWGLVKSIFADYASSPANNPAINQQIFELIFQKRCFTLGLGGSAGWSAKASGGLSYYTELSRMNLTVKDVEKVTDNLLEHFIGTTSSKNASQIEAQNKTYKWSDLTNETSKRRQKVTGGYNKMKQIRAKKKKQTGRK